jgi:hypothetical protein
MIIRSFRHVTRILSQAPIRGFATGPAITASNEILGKQVIPESLKYLDIKPARDLRREQEIVLARTLKASHLVKCRFGPDTYFTSTVDRYIPSKDVVLSRSIERMNFYERKRTLEPLWIDIISVTGLHAYVREKGKRYLRRALAKALIARGVHPLGWDLKAYKKYWDAQHPMEQEDHNLHANQEWMWQIPATLRGTLVIRITQGQKLALSSSKDIRFLATAIVYAIMRLGKTGPRLRQRPPGVGPKPWLQRIRHDGGEPHDFQHLKF